MRALRLVRRTDRLAPISLLAAAFAVAQLALGGTALAAEDDATDGGDEASESAPIDDFLQDDFLDDGFSEDDFLSEDFLEAAEDEAPVERGLYYWGFEVPVDVLVIRPMAFFDSAAGLMLFTTASVAITPPMAVTTLIKSWGEDGSYLEYWDRGNYQQAWQQTVVDPWEYTWRRPLGQLTSY